MGVVREGVWQRRHRLARLELPLIVWWLLNAVRIISSA